MLRNINHDEMLFNFGVEVEFTNVIKVQSYNRAIILTSNIEFENSPSGTW